MKTALIIIFIFIMISLVIVGLPLLTLYWPGGTTSGFSLFPRGPAGIFKSSDGGVTWAPRGELLSGGTLDNAEILDITIDPRDSAKMYAATRSKGMYHTATYGESWSRFGEHVPEFENAAVYRILVDPTDTKRVYAAVVHGRYGYVYKTEDGGATFRSTYITSRENQSVTNLEMDPQNPRLLYLTTSQGGVLKSSDRGESWEAMEWVREPIRVMRISNENPPTLYLATSRGLWRSRDRGATFEDLSEILSRIDFDASTVSAIQFDRSNTSVLYLGTRHGLLRSRDRGATFTVLPLIVPPDMMPIESVEVSPRSSSVMYVGSGPQIFRSEDRGRNWKVAKLESERVIKVIKIDYNDPKNIYLGIGNK